MSPDEFDALQEVLIRRLHSTRDPELQALLWQMAEYCDEMRSSWLMAHRALSDNYRRIKAYGIQATTPIEGRSADGNPDDSRAVAGADGEMENPA